MPSKPSSRKAGFTTSSKVYYEALKPIVCAECGHAIQPGEHFKRSVVGEVRHKKTLPTCRTCEPFQEAAWSDEHTHIVVDSEEWYKHLDLCRIEGKYALHQGDFNRRIYKEKLGMRFDSVEELLKAIWPAPVKRWWLC